MIHLRLFLFLVTFFPSIALGAKPNFVLIFTDDQGYGDLGCFGSVSVSGVGKDWEDRHAYESDNQAVQLFDLEKDLAQKNNLAAEYPERIAELQALTKKIR